MISVILITYNLSQYISYAIESVINQTYTNWECLIIDDGSTDDTKNKVDFYSTRHSNITYYYQKNKERSAARNLGISLAKGDYIQFLDADDFLNNKKFEIQLQSDFTKEYILVSDYLPIADITNEFVANRYVSPFLGKYPLFKMILGWELKYSIPCHSFLIPRKIIIQNKISFDTNLNNHEDWVFWCQLLYYSRKIKFQNEKLAYYRIRDNATCVDQKVMLEGFANACNVLFSFYIQRIHYPFAFIVEAKKNKLISEPENKYSYKNYLFRLIYFFERLTHL